jgi:choline-sulfatase
MLCQPFVLLRSIAGLVLSLLSLFGATQAAATAQPLNVLFLICDDLNCDLGCYGHPLVRSPHIDQLARRGVRFENAYCQYPLCGPSRASFMTGLYPDQTGIHRNAIYVREHLPHVQTLSQMFRNQGYFATRIGKIYHYSVPAHIGTGGHDDPFSWDYTINPRGRDKTDEHLVFSLRRGQYGGTLSWLAAEGTDREQTDGIAADEAVKLLQQYAQGEQPFFLAVGLYRPHTPYVAPKKYFDHYPREELRLAKVPEGYLDTLPAPARATLTRKRDQVDLPEELARQAMQAYYASITFADAQVGRILAALDETGLAQRTVVLFTSDHGYHMGEHGHWQKTTLFENAARVPLIIARPGSSAAGQHTASLAEMVDFYPTLAELCGISPPPELPGVSLAPVLSDVALKPRDSALTQFESGYSLRTARYRYTEWGANGRDGVELYDRQVDPEEMHNLAHQEQHRELMDRLAKSLHRRTSAAQEVPARANRRRR